MKIHSACNKPHPASHWFLGSTRQRDAPILSSSKTLTVPFSAVLFRRIVVVFRVHHTEEYEEGLWMNMGKQQEDRGQGILNCTGTFPYASLGDDDGNLESVALGGVSDYI